MSFKFKSLGLFVPLKNESASGSGVLPPLSDVGWLQEWMCARGERLLARAQKIITF